MLGESTVQDRTLRGNKLKCHKVFENYVNQNFRRKEGTAVEFADGPSGWSRWTGQSRGSQKPLGSQSQPVRCDRTSTVFDRTGKGPYFTVLVRFGTVRWYGTVEISRIRRPFTSLIINVHTIVIVHLAQ